MDVTGFILLLTLITILSVSGVCSTQTFEELRGTLGGPVRASTWYGRCVNGSAATNIQYLSNPDGRGYHSARYTFTHRVGNCSDAAQFYYEVLGYHGYQLILMEAWSKKNGHAVCVIKWKGKYDYLSNYGYNPCRAESLAELANVVYPNGRLMGYRVLKRNYREVNYENRI